MGYSSFDSTIEFGQHLNAAFEFLEGSQLPLGIEVDMDSIRDMPSSRFRAVYLHLPEGAPVIDTDNMIKVGKTLAYLVLDFVKT